MGATTKKATPDDLIPASEAARIAQTTPATLRRWADEGRLDAYVREGFKRVSCFYSRREVEALVPRAR